MGPAAWDSDDEPWIRQGIIQLLNDSAIRDPAGIRRWRYGTLCRILTRERIREALGGIWSEVEADRVAHEIGPLYDTDDDARKKRAIQTAEEPKRFLKIFAILLFMDKPKAIKQFIESNTTDRDLPLDPEERKRRGLSHRPLPACFAGWRRNNLAKFDDSQSQFDLSDFALRLSAARGHLDGSERADDDAQVLESANTSSPDIFPWRVVRDGSEQLWDEQLWDKRACEVVRCVEIDLDCEPFGDLMEMASTWLPIGAVQPHRASTWATAC